MKKFFNKKILFIFSLFLFFIFINCNPVSAEEVLITSETYNKSFIDSHTDIGQSPFDAVGKIVDYYNENYPTTITFTSSELPKNAIMVYFNYEENNVVTSTDYYFFFSDIQFNMNDVFSETGGLMGKIARVDNVTPPYYSFWCRLTDGGLTFGSQDIEYNTPGSDGTSYHTLYFNNSWSVDSSSVVASTFDILDTSGTVVFQQPTLRKATTLAPVIQREKTKGTLQVVLMEIIQILPLILVVLASFLGLRKALKMLLNLLNRLKIQ